jgi:flagellar basal-body rod modification protein FlgD
MSSIQATSGTSNANQTDASASATAKTSELTKNMFMQLLVAQLKNQDPLNPADGTQFVSQLAQMQQLEASVNLGQDVTAIRDNVQKLIAASSAS